MKIKIILLLILAVVTIYLSTTRYLWDDAVISYRFCQNFLLGKGFVSYDGGPRVEGYSNPSLIFLTIGIAKIIGISDIANILRIGLYLNTLALLTTCWLLLKWGQDDWTWISAFALILFAPVHLYRATGLETCLYTFFITLSVYGFSQKKYKLGLVAAFLVALSRPEGIGLAVWLGGIYLLNPEKQSWKSRFRDVLLWLVAPLGLFLIWRYLYFGDFVSVTTISKTHFKERGVWEGMGFSYLFKSQVAAPILIVISLLTLIRFIRQKQNAIYEITTVVFQMCFILLAGGDDWFFERYRFIVPVLPILMRSLGIIPQLMNSYKPLVAAVILLLVCFCPVATDYLDFRETPWVHEAYHDIIGVSPENRLKNFLNPEPYIDVFFSLFLRDNVPESGKNLLLTGGQGGALPLYWRGAFQDVSGLVSREFASLKTEARKKLVRESQPDLFAEYISIPDHHYIENDSIYLDARFFSEKEFDEMGYKPVLIFIAKWPPIARNGKLYHLSGCDLFVAYSQNDSFFNIENPSWITTSLFNGRKMEIPVVDVQVPA